MAKYLIVNADDYGMCKSANDAVEDLFLTGNLKSSTIMMPCPCAEDAVKFSVEHPEFAIGVHLTMTSEWDEYRWPSLSGGKSLEDEDGFLWDNSRQVGKFAKLKELEAEIRAQVDKAHALGMKPSHLDNHMGSLYGHITLRFSLMKMTLRVCGEYGYAFRLFTNTDKRICPSDTPYAIYRPLKYLTRHWGKKFGVIMPDYLLFPDWPLMCKTICKDVNGERTIDYEDYRAEILRIWTDIPDGVTETFLHPAMKTEELMSITGAWWQRTLEYKLMKDPYTHEYLKAHGVELISYRELIEMKKK